MNILTIFFAFVTVANLWKEAEEIIQLLKDRKESKMKSLNTITGTTINSTKEGEITMITTINDFAELIVKEVSERLGADYEVRSEEIRKNNGLNLMAVIISEGNSNIFPTIYLEKHFEDYLMGKCLEAIIEEIIDTYEEHKVPCMMDVSCINDFEKIKDRICLRLVNAKKNAELLLDVPHKLFYDLAALFTINFQSDEEVSATSLIHNSHLGAWGITDIEELFDIALENSKRLLPAHVMSLPEMLFGMMGEDTFADEAMPESDNMLYVLTNMSRAHGATAMLYQDAIKGFAEEKEKDVFILPSSIHELMLLPDDGSSTASDLKCLVREVNATEVAEQEILSDNVYRYNRTTETIEML